jgi:hypothetical protein
MTFFRIFFFYLIKNVFRFLFLKKISRQDEGQMQGGEGGIRGSVGPEISQQPELQQRKEEQQLRS